MDKYIAIPRTSDHSSDALIGDDEFTTRFPPTQTQRSVRYRFLENIQILLLYTIIAFLLAVLFGSYWNSTHCEDPSIGIYSPAQDAVAYKTVKFIEYLDENHGGRSPYTQTPSAEVDAMWKDLYGLGTSEITAEEASKLYDPTVSLPNNKSTFVIELNVFHQLHCVNHLRKALYPDEYPGLWSYDKDGTVDHNSPRALHWDHCIDNLRQTLMCHADITPTPFFEANNKVYEFLVSSHTCRDFDRIKEWAETRRSKHQF